MKQLRPSLTLENFKSIYREARACNDYDIIGLEEDGKLIALMGYRIVWDYVHGKHIYIDDLVTDESVRSKGHGATLLKHAESIARLNQCTNLRLCTGMGNEGGKKFYERNSWNFRAVVYKKKL